MQIINNIALLRNSLQKIIIVAVQLLASVKNSKIFSYYLVIYFFFSFLVVHFITQTKVSTKEDESLLQFTLVSVKNRQQCLNLHITVLTKEKYHRSHKKRYKNEMKLGRFMFLKF